MVASQLRPSVVDQCQRTLKLFRFWWLFEIADKTCITV